MKGDWVRYSRGGSEVAMTDRDLAFASIAELAPRLAAREISPVELTDATLARIERLEPQLNAYITVTAESARHAARAAEAAILAGHYHGPLHGIPVAIKDLYATRGVATTFGSPLYADWVPDFDAAAVEQLKRKVACHPYPRSNGNPRNPRRDTVRTTETFGSAVNRSRHGHAEPAAMGSGSFLTSAGRDHDDAVACGGGPKGRGRWTSTRRTGLLA